MRGLGVVVMVGLLSMDGVAEGGGGAGASWVVHGGGRVDNEGDAVSCITCHDGAATGALGYRLAGRADESNPLGSHPVEIFYPAPAEKQQFFPPGKIMQAGLRLREGKVTCISCHDLRLEGRPYYVPVTLERSALCLTCHRI